LKVSDELDIESLLADILDDSKPLPTRPTVAQAVVNTQLNATGNQAGTVAMDDPESFLESLMADDAPANPTPMDVAQAAEIGVEMVLADTRVMAEDLTAGTPPEPLGDIVARQLKEGLKEAGIDAAVEVTKPGPLVTQRVTDTVQAAEDDMLDALLGPELSPAERAATTSRPELAAPVDVSPSGVFTDSEEREEGSQLKPVKIPTFTAADFAQTMDIRNFATLVTLNTARWHAKVKDRQAAQSAATAASDDDSTVEAAAFEVRKRLLVGADTKLKQIHRAIDEARHAHYAMTLPWTTTSLDDHGRRTGGRLLPNTLFVEYTTVMAAKMKQMHDALDSFIPEYPQLVEAARKKLGKRFDPREYPNVSSIRKRFDLSFDFQPIPKGDDFAGLPQAQLDALANKVNDNTRLMAENAMQDAWCRLYEVVAKMAERLSSPDKGFHNTLVQHVRDTARLLGHLNVTGDQRVEDLRKRVEKHLCQHEAKELRENPTLRLRVGAMAQSIVEEMNK
jgi:hypothetical protein